MSRFNVCPTKYLQRVGGKMRAIAMTMALALPALVLQAQTVNPVRYWTFDGAAAGTDNMGVNNLNFATYASQYTINTGGQVGKYLTLNDQSWLIDGGPLTLSTGLTVEFLMKPGYKFNSTKLISRGDDVFFIRFDYPKIVFYTFHISSSGAYIMDEFVVDLDGIGRKSYGYYIDGNWHHLVFKMNTATGQKEIWVDGQLPSGFSKTLTTGTFPNAGNLNLFLNHNVSYVKYHGSIDEIAVYNTAIPNALIYKHYLGFQSGQPYNFVNNYAGSIPSASAVTAGIDINEYPPGHPNVNVSAIQQLTTFPVPRHKPGHTMLPNFNWMDPKYMGGLFQPGVTTSAAVANSITIQTELAKNFNFYFNVGAGTDIFDTSWVAVANANPSFKLGMNIFRAQLNGNRPDLTSQSKPNNHYLQNASGQFLDQDGNVTSSYKWWRPSAPPSSYTADGQSILNSLNNLFTRLNRGVDLINDNGEVFPHYTDVVASKDPVVTADKNASGLDWNTYLGRKFMENETQSFRNIFMSHPRMANGKFTEFAIDGYPQYRYKYSEARKVNTMINGQYYSTPDFFTRFPSNWRNWVSAWHGWQWIVEIRAQELALGDKLFSPFVCAGYDTNEELNIRPAQWLGLLKCVGMAGAEFYYPAYFSLTSPFPDAKRWAWQVTIPAYAQGIASRYEDLLRNGYLMNGDVGNSYINPTAPGYSFWTGDLRKLAVVRKHNSIAKYAITGTIQPNNNMINGTENESVATINLDGQMVSFKVRRQGSTYIYDKSNPSAPVFYQLDGWHEKSFPYYWSKDFNMEAELFDNSNSQVVLKTTVPAGTQAGNYTNFTTCVSWPDNAPSYSPVEYNFQPRSGASTQYYLWVRARSRGGVTTSMNIQLDNGSARTIGCISDTNWTWYRYDACNQQRISYTGVTSAITHTLRITPGNGKLEIDQVLLTADGNMVLNSAPANCSGSTATIAASGPLNFCSGGSVVLTASSGSSYLWSPGNQTTQSITVSASGSYTVQVSGSGGCAGTSAPTVVTVSTPPTATITASGPLNIPSGGNVTLTASSGSSYLWSPGGQTTQSITVSTAGSYTVAVTNSSGCSKTSSPAVVTVNSSVPVATITASGPTTFCQGGNVTLTANTGTSYLWSTGATTKSISASSSGSYVVTVTTSGVGTATSTATVVNVVALPTATITPSGSLNLPAGGSVTLTSSSGSSYLWSPGNQTTKSITVSTAGSYTVRVTNSSGCSKTSVAAVVTVGSSAPQATITATGATTFCPGSRVLLTASSGSSYLWSTGATTKSIYASTGGQYVVTVTTNGVGSSTSAPFTVTVHPAPTQATITASGSTALCTGQSVVLTASPGILYSWSPGGQTSQSITVTTAGTYKVTTYNSNGCSSTSAGKSVTVTTCGSSYCNPPTGLYVSNVQANNATFHWTPPTSGSPTEYVLKYKNMLTGVVYQTHKLPSVTTSLIITLSPSTRYRWWVKSWCGSSVSAWSSYHDFTTAALRMNEPEGDVNSSPSVEIFETLEDETVVNLDAEIVQVFPNPASSSASISFKSPSDAKYTVSLQDINGKRVYEEVIDGAEGYNIHDMELSHLPKGIYMVSLSSDVLTSHKKLIIQ